MKCKAEAIDFREGGWGGRCAPSRPAQGCRSRADLSMGRRDLWTAAVFVAEVVFAPVRHALRLLSLDPAFDPCLRNVIVDCGV